MSSWCTASGVLVPISVSEYEDIIDIVYNNTMLGFSKEEIKDELDELMTLAGIEDYKVVCIKGSHYKVFYLKDQEVENQVSLKKNADGSIDFNMNYFDYVCWDEALGYTEKLTELGEK